MKSSIPPTKRRLKDIANGVTHENKLIKEKNTPTKPQHTELPNEQDNDIYSNGTTKSESNCIYLKQVGYRKFVLMQIGVIYKFI